MTPENHQRLLLGVLLAVHDSDEAAFRALLSGVPRAALVTVLRGLAEVVVGNQVVTEEAPGAAREGIAREALNLAAR